MTDVVHSTYISDLKITTMTDAMRERLEEYNEPTSGEDEFLLCVEDEALRTEWVLLGGRDAARQFVASLVKVVEDDSAWS